MLLNIAAILAFARKAQAVAAIAPAIVDIASSLNAVMPKGTPGKEKMEVLTGYAKAGLTAAGMVEEQFNHLWPDVQQLVEKSLAAGKAIAAAAGTGAPAPAPQVSGPT